ncbi:quinone oxidoreductase [Geodermatophilus sp. DF01-2]|uniref:zinc-binding dehydrogenase n=1 Tax=Geodermatophilus sp. DF01-2 TaxID=2559610 RepID=UPI001073D7CA|nr:zinc-binding dehydrogenase [Geodermatophilus sp. DF01_2]TFV54295.1 quinone oxidoreductase [Geodermatophilus sp. DF01_2]
MLEHAPPTVPAVVAREGRLSPTELSAPPPDPGQLLVRVRLAGVNYWDVMQRTGAVPLPPSGIPGVEGVGVVAAAGEGAPADLVGRRVAWSKVNGSYAGAVVGNADWFLPVPDDVDDEQGAGLLMQGVTAQYLATDTAPLGDGDAAVVLAAAGGVGTLLTQLLVAAGVGVIGVVGSAAKVEAARAAGATEVFVDSGDDLAAAVREVVPEGVAAVFDGNGGPAATRGVSMLRPRGWLVLFGTAAGPIPDLPAGALGAGSFVVTRTAGKHFAGDLAAWRPRAEDVLARARAGALRVAPVTVLPLAEAARAHELMESRSTTGKLLLRPEA